MLSREQLIEQIKRKKSFLCVGLDPDLDKIPAFLKSYPDPIFEFNKRIIDATKDLCVAYKPNSAFYESLWHKRFAGADRYRKYLPPTP
jgi:orotidine-5'-phosphate decarboxylase